MRKHPVPFLVLAFLLFSTLPAGSEALLVRDLATGSFTGEGSRELDGLELDGFLYFPSDHPRYGTELWRSDGTPEGTGLFVDLCPGPCTSQPHLLAVAGGRMFFFADDGVFGAELWVSDGTRHGTRLVRDVCAGPCDGAGGSPAPAARLGDRLVFAADDGGSGLEPWISDGSRAGTARLVDLCPGVCGSTPRQLMTAGERVFFLAGESADALWSTDGTVGGTRPAASSCLDCQPRADFGGRLVFSRNLPPFGIELWISDGTAVGTRLLADVCPAACDASLDLFGNVAVVGDTLYFTARVDFEGRRRLFRSDGTVEGTVDVLGEPEFRGMSRLRSFDGGLIFTSFDETFRNVLLWQSDGTLDGTSLLVPPVRARQRRFELAVAADPGASDRLFFAALSGYEDSESLWSYRGGSLRFLGFFDAPPGISPAVTGFAALPGGVLFKAYEAEVGVELWRSDGTSSGTARVADLDAGVASSDPLRLTVLGERALFVAGADEGTAIWSSDGTGPGTSPLGIGPASTLEFGRLSDRLLFASESGVPGERGLWSSDGSATGTSLIAGGIFAARGFVESGGRSFFAGGGEGGSELHVSDGTVAGTGLVVDLTPGLEPTPILPCCPRETRPHDLVAFEDGVLFGAATGYTTGVDDELWRSDGTEAGTARVRDICEGECSSTPRELTRLGALVYFSAEEPERGRELWRSDGTAAGTRRVVDLRHGPESSEPHGLFVLGERLYFFARGPRFWREALWGPLDRSQALGETLWVTDGTARGTKPVRNLALSDSQEGRVHSWVTEIETVGDRAFFVVVNELTGPELWTSDGTAEGTGLLRDLRPGPAGSYPGSLTALGGLLVFTADDGLSGAEAWVSDGTPAGTRLLADVAAGEESSRPAGFALLGDLLLMSAETSATGRELWAVSGATSLDVPRRSARVGRDLR